MAEGYVDVESGGVRAEDAEAEDTARGVLPAEEDDEEGGEAGEVYAEGHVYTRPTPLPQLPSHRFSYSVWHDLRQTTVHGPQLKAPRVREGPPIKTKLFTRIIDQHNQRIHHTRTGRDKLGYQKYMEDWENAKQFCNLSYQDLAHDYQKKALLKVLKRLIRVEDLSLVDNGLTDLQTISFPVCKRLNLTTNFLKSLKALPQIPRIECLIVSENHIEELTGIERLRNSPITSLYMDNNPVAFTLNYRQRVFQALPNLQILDGVKRLSEDDVFQEDENKGGCVIS